jgi:hypothetical protein
LGVQHESAGAKIGFVVNDKANLEVVFRVRNGDFDVVLFELDFLFQLEHLLKLLASLARLEDCRNDKTIEFAILLLPFTFGARKRSRRSRIRRG